MAYGTAVEGAGAFELENFFPHRLAAAQRAVGAVLATTYQREFGLSLAEWKVMSVLSTGEPRAQREMLTGVALDKVSVSRAVQSLLDMGLVERTRDVGDRRSHLLRLSGDGIRLSARIEAMAVSIEARLLAGWSSREVEMCAAHLRRVEAAARALLDPPAEAGQTSG